MVNTRYRSAEVADIVSRSGAKALFLWPDFRGIDFPAILRDIDPGDLASLKALVSVFPAGEAGEDGDAARLGGIPAIRFGEFLADGAASGLRPPRRTILPEAGVAIFTTSGTTSKPKFVLHSQQNVTRHNGRDPRVRHDGERVAADPDAAAVRRLRLLLGHGHHRRGTADAVGGKLLGRGHGPGDPGHVASPT